MEIWGTLASIGLQNSAYLAALSYMAWSWERRRGADAFHLVVAYAAASWLTWLLVTKAHLAALPALLFAGVVAFAIAELWPETRPSASSERVLVRVIVLASVSMIAFDWLTAHTPISLAPAGRSLTVIAVVVAGLGWLTVFGISQSRYAIKLRLGVHNRWALEYWQRPLPQTSVAFRVAMYCCWIPVLALPLTTTGLVSATILKDVAIAILLARVTGARGPAVLLGTSATVGALRSGVAYAVVGNMGPPLVEARSFFAYWHG